MTFATGKYNTHCGGAVFVVVVGDGGGGCCLSLVEGQRQCVYAKPTWPVLTPSPSSRLPPAHSTCTADRLDCDAKFLECMKTRCLSEPKEQQESCRSSAGLYHMVCPCHHVTMTVCVRERACVVCAFVYVDVCVAPVHCV